MKNTNWKVSVIIGVGVLAVILMIVFGVQSSQNKAIALEEQVNTASSDIKVQEKRRVDLVYNLADCVKQYDKHEADTLTAVADGRGSTGDIENVTTAIAAVAEAYPELKSNENYKTLMNELSMTENMIAEYRSNYNKQIKEYKRYVRKFPTRQFIDLLVNEEETIENAAKVSGIGDMKLVDVLKTISEMEFESIKAFSSAVAGMNSMKEAIHTVKDLDDALVELKKSSEK